MKKTRLAKISRYVDFKCRQTGYLIYFRLLANADRLITNLISVDIFASLLYFVFGFMRLKLNSFLESFRLIDYY